MEIKVKNLPPPEVTGLVVGNHMGFVDIMVMCTVLPSLFVTSQDMRETPLLGLLTELGGCLYVDRKSRVNIMNELKEIIE
ncbi:MAG: 1-acyl-sn-glycerol-3-phosphate acyltransferase, partial [Bdellovibrionota bacterium]